MKHKVDQTTPESIRNHITELKSHLLKSCISVDFFELCKTCNSAKRFVSKQNNVIMTTCQLSIINFVKGN